MLSRLASWRAPAAEAPTGRNLFCTGAAPRSRARSARSAAPACQSREVQA